MHRNHSQIMIIEASAAQFRVFKIETQRLHEVEFGTGNGRESDRVTGVAGDFRRIEDDA